jgi:predicted O-methyltransferase YrrM
VVQPARTRPVARPPRRNLRRTNHSGTRHVHRLRRALDGPRTAGRRQADRHDVNEDAHALARKYWEKAGVANRIELHVGEIGNRLPPLVPDLAGKVDFAFIDADKPGYGAYYDTCIELVRPGGILVFDNVLQRGAVADPDANPSRKHGRIMRTFNDRLRADDRITMSILPVGDGVLVARKK